MEDAVGRRTESRTLSRNLREGAAVVPQRRHQRGTIPEPPPMSRTGERPVQVNYSVSGLPTSGSSPISTTSRRTWTPRGPKAIDGQFDLARVQGDGGDRAGSDGLVAARSDEAERVTLAGTARAPLGKAQAK
jgi:hypothetical protein